MKPEPYIDTFKPKPKCRLTLAIEKALTEKRQDDFFALAGTWDILNPKRRGLETARCTYNGLKEDNMLYLVEEYKDCKDEDFRLKEFEDWMKQQ